MKNRITKLTTALILLLVLCGVVCLLAIYSINNPNKVIIISKDYSPGYTFRGHISGVIFPQYKITVVNAFRMRTIYLNKTEWDRVLKWQKYNTKYPFYIYW